MKNAAEIGSGAMLCIPTLIETGGGEADRMKKAQTLLLFFLNKESRPKI
jgi:hypothetical protein